MTADLTATVRILGLDPGSRRTGFGVIEIGPGTQRCLAHGRIEVDGLEVQARLARIHAGVCELIARFAPTEVAVEKVFVSRNVDSALKLGQARGAALAAIGEAIELAEYAPRAIKLAVVGFGGADKLQVAHMMRSVLEIEGRSLIHISEPTRLRRIRYAVFCLKKKNKQKKIKNHSTGVGGE